jgi:hypothetical protein
MPEILCSACNKISIGMFHWPTDTDPYVCIDCIRKKYAEVLGRLLSASAEQINLLDERDYWIERERQQDERAIEAETDNAVLRAAIKAQCKDCEECSPNDWEVWCKECPFKDHRKP